MVFSELEARRIGCLKEMTSDYKGLIWFMDFIDEVGITQWKEDCLRLGEARRLKGVFSSRRKDFEISSSDPKWQLIEEWLDYVSRSPETVSNT